ncbi:hypothetical protein LSH36_1676g00001 [Paralvinella palmiformis]|uniref:Uncharacterized protein n=1 Tax=Paralvinella palmiformis TaxID=53620 RepID=A0AAD9ISV7_9ANNE|nr:hypothetical protein LSH36_1676g00001 [Paralvinella palmiformis]
MTDIRPAPNRGIKDHPLSRVIAADCLKQPSEECPSAQNVQAINMDFILYRSSHKPMPSWTLYNQTPGIVSPENTTECAEQLGRAQMRVFVDKRLCEPVDSDQHMDLKSHIQNNKAKTFAFLYEVVQPSKGKAKAYQSGQEHPTKAYRANVTLYETSCLLIDGQGLVMELGNPLDIRTIGAKLRRIDLVFDMYQGESIKTGTKAKRKQRHRPIRRKIENEGRNTGWVFESYDGTNE